MKNYDLSLLKKKYGERFAKMCRTLFPEMLEKEGFLSSVITENFAESKFLFDDIKDLSIVKEFKDYVLSFASKKEGVSYGVAESPFALMKKAGYTLYEIKHEDEKFAFTRYWKDNELICTFWDEYRTATNLVFFAVKDGAEKIKREKFKNPQREDEYGTSVISIQFSKRKPNSMVILNRYNHAVANPDATFSNNLDNIIKGLTESFAISYDLEFKPKESNFYIPGYVKANDGKLYKYNQERLGYYFCLDNTIITSEGDVKKFDKDRYLLFDYYLIDLKENKVNKAIKEVDDSFEDSIKDIVKTQVFKDGENKVLVLTTNNDKSIIITLNKFNNIVKYHNPDVKKINNNFINYESKLNEISLPNVKEIGGYFLTSCTELNELNLPSVEKIGDSALLFNRDLNKVNLPKLKEIGGYFLRGNFNLTHLNLPNVERVGKDFLYKNRVLEELNMPNDKFIDENFLFGNQKLKVLNLPNVEETKNRFMPINKSLVSFSAPKLKKTGLNTLNNNKNIFVAEVVKDNTKTTEIKIINNNNNTSEREMV